MTAYTIDRDCWRDLYKLLQEYGPKIQLAPSESRYALWCQITAKIGIIAGKDKSRWPMCKAVVQTLEGIEADARQNA